MTRTPNDTRIVTGMIRPGRFDVVIAPREGRYPRLACAVDKAVASD